MRCLVSCHHLTSVCKDGGGEEAEGVDACLNERVRDTVCEWNGRLNETRRVMKHVEIERLRCFYLCGRERRDTRSLRL